MGDSGKEYHSYSFSRTRNGLFHVEGFIDCTHKNRNLLNEDIQHEETYSDSELNYDDDIEFTIKTYSKANTGFLQSQP